MLGRSSLAGRYHPELSGARVKGFNISALLSSRGGNPYDRFLTIGRDFGNRVRAALEIRKEVDWSKTVFFGYDTGFFEPGRWVRERGGTTIICQMDPSRFEVDLVREEEKRWPGWAKHPLEIPEAYFQRREQEWAAADIVMVNSEWTKAALIQQGVPESKIATVPLVFEEKALVESRESRAMRRRDLTRRRGGAEGKNQTLKLIRHSAPETRHSSLPLPSRPQTVPSACCFSGR